MAKLFISEFIDLFAGPVGKVGQAAQGPPLVEQALAVGAVVASNAFNPRTRLIRVHTDLACSIAMGVAPTATTDSMRMAANQTEYFGVPAGLGHKISVIANP